jgi:hypothetical protein
MRKLIGQHLNHKTSVNGVMNGPNGQVGFTAVLAGENGLNATQYAEQGIC